MNNKTIMFEKYPDVVEVNQLREMLGGISRKLAYKLLSEKEIHMPLTSCGTSTVSHSPKP